VKPSFSHKLKKVAVRLLFVSSASYAMLAPFAAAASFFSLGSVLAQTAQTSQAASGSYNSQTVPILASAVNLDPSPSIGGGDITVEGAALLPQAGPEGTAADIANAPQNASISVYTVHAGDTLATIAQMFGVTVNTIVWANDIKGGVVHEGDQLIILPVTGVQYTVKAGDTLESIAKAYNADANEIAQYNGLDASAALTPGSSLIIPNGEVAPRSSSSSGGTKHSKPANAGSGKAAGAFEPYLGGSGPSIPGYYSWPVAGGVITQGLHGWNAVDIGAPTGTSIYAAAAGTVIVAKQNGAYNGGYGNYVVVAHPNGTQTLYGHMSRVLTTVGAHVTSGEVIGKVGETGWATGPHLHFEVRGAANPFAN
jgi:LysM repeat protein